MKLSTGITFGTSNGGTVRTVGVGEFTEFGLTDDGFAFYDDLAVNPSIPVTLTTTSPRYNVEGTIEHLTGETVMRFRLLSRQPNGRADIRLSGLKSESWYRLQFDGVLAKTESGRAHAQSSPNGLVQFNGVHLPND
jgi:hypothetical protein